MIIDYATCLASIEDEISHLDILNKKIKDMDTSWNRKTKGRTIRCLGGGGLVFLLLANFFLPPRENNFFFGNQRPTIFFLCIVEEFFWSYAFPIMYVTIWCFFWSTYFSQISTTNFFFLPTFSTNIFFLLFVATNNFFLFFSSPPPQISNGASLNQEEAAHKKAATNFGGKYIYHFRFHI